MLWYCKYFCLCTDRKFLRCSCSGFTFQDFSSLNDPVYATWLTQNIDAKVRATVISMRGHVDAFGQIVGGPPVGYIGTAFSIRAALLASGVLLSPVLVLYAYASRKINER